MIRMKTFETVVDKLKVHHVKPKMIQAVDDMVGYEIPEPLKKFRNSYD
jgi:EH domain-containing protein 1